jgi:heat shock protein HslJ
MTRIAAGRPRWRPATVLAGLVIALLVAACTSSTATPSPAASASPGASGGSGLDGTWVLTKYTSPDGTSFTVPAAVTPTLTLQGNAASGNAGCNTFNAIATITPTTITFSQVASTKIACQDPMATVEAAYLQALNLQTSYTLSGDTLTMQGPGGNPSLTFIRAT